MKLTIQKEQGLYDELELVMHRDEIEDVVLSMPYAETLNGYFGITRHALADVPDDLKGRPCSFDPRRAAWFPFGAGLEPYKPGPVEHLRSAGLVDLVGEPRKRVVSVGNRNLGNNWGVVAFHEDWPIRCFALRGEPIAQRSYTCLVRRRDSGLGVEELRFMGGDEAKPTPTRGTEAPGNEIRWATFGNQVLAAGRIRQVQEMAGDFYDIRHLVSLRHDRDAVEMTRIWESYPDGFGEKVLAAIEAGVPRSRYLHNCVALDDERVGIIQKYGTPEELAATARRLGFRDAVILDNGGSVFTYAWFVREEKGGGGTLGGGYAFTAADWRPGSISTVSLVLRGPVLLKEQRGSVGFHIA